MNENYCEADPINSDKKKRLGEEGAKPKRIRYKPISRRSEVKVNPIVLNTLEGPTMENIKVNISYWTYPEGDDFDGIELFTRDLLDEYKSEIRSERTDALGGGLYELVVEIVCNFNFADIAGDLIKDGVVGGIAYFWKPIFKKIKDLFQKNKKLHPDIEVAKFIFNDIEIVIYPIYSNSVDEIIDEVIKTLTLYFPVIESRTKAQIKAIHIPIFNHVDNYKLCAYRVKLNVDENIESFSRDDYFKLWGVRCNESDFIYDLQGQSLLKAKFYTQNEYDELWDRKYKSK